MNIIALILSAFLFVSSPPPPGITVQPNFAIQGTTSEKDRTLTSTPHLEADANFVDISFESPKDSRGCILSLVEVFPNPQLGLRMIALQAYPGIKAHVRVYDRVQLPTEGDTPDAPWWNDILADHYTIALECVEDFPKPDGPQMFSSSFYTVKIPKRASVAGP